MKLCSSVAYFPAKEISGMSNEETKAGNKNKRVLSK